MSRPPDWKVGDVLRASRFKYHGEYHHDVWLIVRSTGQGVRTDAWFYVTLLVPHMTCPDFDNVSFDANDKARRVSPARWPDAVCKAMALRSLAA